MLKSYLEQAEEVVGADMNCTKSLDHVAEIKGNASDVLILFSPFLNVLRGAALANTWKCEVY